MCGPCTSPEICSQLLVKLYKKLDNFHQVPLAEPAYDHGGHVPTIKFFWKKITYYMYIKRGRFNTPLSEKTKMSVCFWFYDAKKRKARKKCCLGESLNWNWTKRKKKKNCRWLTFKEEDLRLIAHVVLTAPRGLLYISLNFRNIVSFEKN